MEVLSDVSYGFKRKLFGEYAILHYSFQFTSTEVTWIFISVALQCQSDSVPTLLWEPFCMEFAGSPHISKGLPKLVLFPPTNFYPNLTLQLTNVTLTDTCFVVKKISTQKWSDCARSTLFTNFTEDNLTKRNYLINEANVTLVSVWYHSDILQSAYLFSYGRLKLKLDERGALFIQRGNRGHVSHLWDETVDVCHKEDSAATCSQKDVCQRPMLKCLITVATLLWRYCYPGLSFLTHSLWEHIQKATPHSSLMSPCCASGRRRVCSHELRWLLWTITDSSVQKIW